MKFFRSLRASASYEVQVLSRIQARNVQSVTGNNLRYIEALSGENPWTVSSNRLRTALTVQELVEVPEQDIWRLTYLRSLISQRREAKFEAEEAEEERITELINSLVIN